MGMSNQDMHHKGELLESLGNHLFNKRALLKIPIGLFYHQV